MPDTDLASRIVATLALVLAVDVAFALLVAALLEPWVAPLLTGLVGVSRPSAYGALVALTLLGLLAIQLRYTRYELLAEADAREVSAETHPDLHARVTRLAAQANVRVPAVAVADSAVPNSFTVGGLRGGTLVVSDGLLETLSPEELDAVLAHELAHLANRDALVMTLASFLPALVADDYAVLEEELPEGAKPVVLLAVFACWFLLSSAFIDPLLSASGLVQFVVATAVVIVVGGIALGVLATPVVFLSRSLSRQREFAADRAGARIVGDPGAMVSALTTLEGDRAPTADARARYEGLDGMCFLPYGFAEPADDPDEDGFSVETRSHPPTEERIDRLKDLAAELEGA